MKQILQDLKSGHTVFAGEEGDELQVGDWVACGGAGPILIKVAAALT